uniref:B30.2/SPRY domain-containing protein n=1 Tax=Oryzias sinensis TaxID=183150 RepID=A0A8C7Y6P9_9TELE
MVSLVCFFAELRVCLSALLRLAHFFFAFIFVLSPVIARVTLDPKTAYPCLWVSPCRTSVHVGKIQSNLPNNPERFTRYNIVLGSEAFSSGRHYWEVEVGCKTAWGLGVVNGSVNRKEEISLCPQDGFWTLVLRDKGNGTSEYEACTDTDDSLIHPPKPPRRVGVYLDYGRGEVAFYDAEDMSHLFTFSDAKFSEPVFPYFNPWRGTPWTVRRALSFCQVLFSQVMS